MEMPTSIVVVVVNEAIDGRSIGLAIQVKRFTTEFKQED